MNAHIRRALKAGRNLATGWGMIVTLLTLIATGFGLYYVAGEADRPLWSAAHWIVGLAMGLLFVLHIVLGRRGNPQRQH
jgi:membrane protein YdbS with pleckstrin-like domain